MPFLIVILTCILRLNLSGVDLKNPNFQLGRTQAAVSSFVLIFCFIGMLREKSIYIFSTNNVYFSNYYYYILKIYVFRILYTNSVIIFFLYTVTLGCLVLQQRYERRHGVVSYEHVRNNAENSTTGSNERILVDVEDLVSPLINATPM